MRTCLYRHFDTEGSLLYVGIASNADARLADHRAQSRWRAEISRVDLKWFETKEEAHAAERAAIRSEAPKYNRMRYRDSEIHPDTIRRRLEKAGFSCLKDVWVPSAYAKRVREQASMYREDIAKLLAELARPRGRPRKSRPDTASQ